MTKQEETVQLDQMSYFLFSKIWSENKSKCSNSENSWSKHKKVQTNTYLYIFYIFIYLTNAYFILDLVSER